MALRVPPAQVPQAFPSNHRENRSSTLLHLDCSADLTLYSRSLGPRSTQAGTNSGSRQFETQQVIRQPFIFPTFVQGSHTTPSVRNAHTTSSSLAPHSSLISGYFPKPTVQRAQQIQPASTQFFPPHSMPPKKPEYRYPDIGDLSTYPTALREILEQSSVVNGDRTEEDGVIYHAVEHVDSTYMEDSHGIIDTFTDLHEANLKAAEYFLKETWGDGEYIENPEFELRKDGTVHMECETDGSMGGLVSVYVTKGKLKSGKRRRGT